MKYYTSETRRLRSGLYIGDEREILWFLLISRVVQALGCESKPPIAGIGPVRRKLSSPNPISSPVHS